MVQLRMRIEGTESCLATKLVRSLDEAEKVEVMVPEMMMRVSSSAHTVQEDF